MTTGAGAQLIGCSWYDTGTGRGIALLWTLTGLVGLTLTIIATRSRPFRNLAAAIAQHRLARQETPALAEPAD